MSHKGRLKELGLLSLEKRRPGKAGSHCSNTQKGCSVEEGKDLFCAALEKCGEGN